MQVQSEIVSTEDVPASVRFLSPQCTFGDVCEISVASVPPVCSLPDASAHAAAQLDVGFEETPVLACSSGVSLLATSHQSVEDDNEVVPVLAVAVSQAESERIPPQVGGCHGRATEQHRFLSSAQKKDLRQRARGAVSRLRARELRIQSEVDVGPIAGCWEIVWYWCSCCVIVWVPPRKLYGRCLF